mmetsp:Transcript_3729/g.8655  ORF Transcript_3729/g.8655 Transcript_3729/m.8655 type:complete len:257 (-) Transcript_3729:435-1205(-)
MLKLPAQQLLTSLLPTLRLHPWQVLASKRRQSPPAIRTLPWIRKLLRPEHSPPLPWAWCWWASRLQRVPARQQLQPLQSIRQVRRRGPPPPSPPYQQCSAANRWVLTPTKQRLEPMLTLCPRTPGQQFWLPPAPHVPPPQAGQQRLWLLHTVLRPQTLGNQVLETLKPASPLFLHQCWLHSAQQLRALQERQQPPEPRLWAAALQPTGWRRLRPRKPVPAQLQPPARWKWSGLRAGLGCLWGLVQPAHSVCCQPPS